MSRIISLKAQVVPDSRGEKTVRVDLEFESGSTSSAMVPQGKSRGKFEAVSLTAEEAAQNTNEIIFTALKDKHFKDQKELDEFLINLDTTPTKSQLGANAILGVSLAFARGLAQEKRLSLWQYLKELGAGGELKSPRLLVNIIGGGLHANNKLEFQEYLVIPKTQNAKEALTIATKIYREVGNYLKTKFGDVALADEGNFAPPIDDSETPFLIIKEAVDNLELGDQVDFGLDAAAANIKKLPEELLGQYEKLKQNYNLHYLEDPFSEEDFDSFAKLLGNVGGDTLVVGDDLTATNVTRIETARAHQSVNGVIVKSNQIGTLTETIDAIKKAREYNWAVIISHRSGETEDTFIADLAYAVGAYGLKAGAPLARERLVKYERLIEIEGSQVN